ncbi:hypothetical protein D5086_012764 [Populus alba]|uniref:Uncharacterized protein n=1 Tax=Populus alba TaxID=43335 RepID=A0ACC4C4E4_POPAL
MSPEEDDTYPKSSHKYSSVMDCQQSSSAGSIFIEDLSFPAAASSPLMDLEAFSYVSPTTSAHPVSSSATAIEGFRKIDTDRWEFANESFRRGEKHLLKNIHRRKSTQSQQVGSHTGSLTEAGRSGLDSEVERLRKERSVMMQEVIELQKQQSGTVHDVQSVNQRLQAAEQRQKQMVSFLAKLFQNPAFLACLKQKKEQGEIGSSRMKRKFVKHQQHQHALPESSMEGQIMRCMPDWRNITLSSVVPDTSPASIDQSPDYVSEDMVGLGLGSEAMPLPEIVAPDEFAISDELGVGQGFIKTPEQVGEEQSSMQFEDPKLKGKIDMSPQNEAGLEYFVSFPEDLGMEKKLSRIIFPWHGKNC